MKNIPNIYTPYNIYVINHSSISANCKDIFNIMFIKGIIYYSYIIHFNFYIMVKLYVYCLFITELAKEWWYEVTGDLASAEMYTNSLVYIFSRISVGTRPHYFLNRSSWITSIYLGYFLLNLFDLLDFVILSIVGC